jgi:hypothetical protein
MPMYSSSQDSFTVYGDGQGYVVIKQFSRKTDEKVGEVRIPVGWFEEFASDYKTFVDEALHGSEDVERLESE